ncbi:hypothetical protein SDRG_09711 [Saprolegnia diclina VS20]|uniref:F-box domain-containing protein n=1 Tax=Saprolegnia diclina (strain VS20) TaxID=1156394 RepID=T0Q4H7_SAPDV|nr:hypothetical protein SDRG_09711 [Saprolegnia diclina VS20]EQC32739.1 hypothetical protein SDRG_09711 [Saprolegnia diclina VS20]|eukprot:XP_008613883.1 hypothetical protein SDRG_09711 [Saprolegnia diclina VS20]
MSNSEHQATAGRPTPPHALALPHVVEAIATSLSNYTDFENFVHVVPPSLWTPALAAFLECITVMPSSVITYWPYILLQQKRLPPSVMALLAATLPLQPRIHIEWPILDAASLVSLVAVLGPSLSYVTLHFGSTSVADGQAQAINELLLQRCPRLRYVAMHVVPRMANALGELNDALAVIAHPHVRDSYLNLEFAIATPRLGHLLASWL